MKGVFSGRMRRKETIVEALDVTKDAALGMPVVTAVGNCEVYVENFKSIAEYDCNTVKLLTKKGFLSIKIKRKPSETPACPCV